MEGPRTAVVVSHPAHLLTVAGMLLRWRPHVLMLFRAVTGGGVGQEEAMRAALDPLGLVDRLTSFEISETESFNRTLAGDFAFHAIIADRISDWLGAVRPRVVLGDAYEAYNFHHDVTRLLLDDAVQRWRVRGRRIESYEFPLSCRPNEPGALVQYGVFLTGSFRTFQLTATEAATKRALASEVGKGDPFVAATAPLFAHPDTESYREVPPDRDYTAPPPGLALYYDERGAELVSAGLHAQAITFRQHFAPLVRALGLGPAPASREFTPSSRLPSSTPEACGTSSAR